MRGARFFGMLWLAGAAAGCGGQLAAPDAGAGGGPGTGGGGPVDGDTGGSTGGTGGVTELDVYRWAGATVHVTTALGTPDGLKVRRSDEETATVYPPATTPEDDGAVVVAHHTCAAPSLYEVDLWSCGRQHDSNVPPSGCLRIAFTPTGPSGTYVYPPGSGCVILGGMAEIQLPPPRPFSAGAAAVGTFTLDCLDMSETIRTLEGSFALPVQADVLACLSPAD